MATTVEDALGEQPTPDFTNPYWPDTWLLVESNQATGH
jgi:hypothetical protein